MTKRKLEDGFTSVSEIVSICYCEQKMIFELKYGKERPKEIQKLAEKGTAEHKTFEVQGRRIAQGDRRCFIATAVYGPDAPETNQLRAWRDRVLIPSWLGRLGVRFYYWGSPCLVAAAETRPWLAACLRKLVDLLRRSIHD